jgi:hypothetical protein
MMRRHIRSTPATLVLLAGSAQALAGGLGFPAEIDLASLLPANGGDGTVGFVINGIDPNDQSGFSVSSAGDVNGDGFEDVIIGAYTASPDGRVAAGESYVVFGSEEIGEGGVLELSSLIPEEEIVPPDEMTVLGQEPEPEPVIGFIINGIIPGDRSGFSVAGVGDVNDDDIDDLIIGATAADPGGESAAGQAYIVFGSEDLGMDGVLELSSLLPANGGDGSAGFVISGVDAGDSLGVSVATAGDGNGDGENDLIIGAHLASPDGRISAGKSYVVFGGAGLGAGGEVDLTALDGTSGFVLNGVDDGDVSGTSVAAAGDLNGDGTDDLIVGAERAAPNGESYAGESYVVFGGPNIVTNGAGGGAGMSAAAFELSTLLPANGGDGTAGFVINGVNGADRAGRSVAPAGDVNDDGIDDVIVGAFQADPGFRSFAGAAYVVFGAADVGTGGELNLADLDGTNGFEMGGIVAGDRCARSVSGAGDVNGDGIDDVIVGADRAQRGAKFGAGETYVVFGASGIGATGEVDLSALDGSDGFVMKGIDISDVSGWSVSGAGDLNGDGPDDVIIGAYAADPGGRSSAGESYVVFGIQTVPLCAGDVNGDGVTDTFDFGELASNFGAGPGATRAQGDLNGDGIVDTFDFGELAADFGCPN